MCSKSLGTWSLVIAPSEVRLPVPGMTQMGVLNARLADFERQGPSRLCRLERSGEMSLSYQHEKLFISGSLLKSRSQVISASVSYPASYLEANLA